MTHVSGVSGALLRSSIVTFRIEDRAHQMNKNVNLREAQSEDIPGIWSVCSGLIDAFNYFTYEDFYEVCLYRWERNPFRSDEVFGWVLEDGDKIVGFLGLIPMKFKIGSRVVPAVAATTWAVDPRYRAHSLLLYKAFLSLGKKSLLLSTTPSPESSKIIERFKMQKIPLPYFDKRFIWFVKAWYPASWWIKKFKHKSVFVRLFLNGLTLFPIAGLLRLLSMKHRKVEFKCEPLPVERVHVFTDEYDDFWHAQKQGYGITAVRTKEFLNWRHIEMPKILGENYVFACRVDGKLRGYIALYRRVNPQKIAYHFKVTDIFYDVKETGVLWNLLNYTYEFVRKNKGNIYEMDGFSRVVMNEAMKQNPFVKTASTWSYWYKAPGGIGDICSVEDWWPSGIDGDRNM